MGLYAELEIGLHRREPWEYTVEFRFSLPDSAVDARLGPDQPARLKLDVAELRALEFDPQAYAQTLSRSFFADPQVNTLFANARSSVEPLNIPLQVRLLVGESARELHEVYWEMLQDPRDGSPLFTGERIFLSRYVSSPDLRPVKLRPKTELTALVFIASPANADQYQLDPINADEEYRRAALGLGTIPARRYSGPATLDHLIEALRSQKPAILYLVCHGGMRPDGSCLYLEKPGGQVAPVAGAELVTRFKELREPPLLVVLPACESAGRAGPGQARAALGPKLAEAGVPAVVAIQGTISMPTIEQFMPAFFDALQQDGQVDRAMALARGRVRACSDFWMPGLFTRLKTGCIIPAGVAEVKKIGWRVWAAAAGVFLLLLAAGLGAYFYTSWPPPMGEGFNIAFAAFTEVDASGRERVTDQSRQLSEWFYNDIYQYRETLDKLLQFELRGPDQVRAVSGPNREGAAAKLSDRHNASLLIYGKLFKEGGEYWVLPEFYIGSHSFDYASEIKGPDQLGSAIRLGPVIDPQAIVKNRELRVRTTVLRYVLLGLASYSKGDYPQAEVNFETAASDPEWTAGQGKAVAYLLLGAAQLASYDPQANAKALSSALPAFETARDLAPAYPRPYLGLGEVSLLNATLDKGSQAQAELVRQAIQLFTQAEQKAGSAALYGLKARYGQGKAALLRFDARLPGWSEDDAASATQDFQAVISAYEQGDQPQLVWHAAHSHAHLGRLAMWKNDWAEANRQYRESIRILENLPGAPSKAWVARYWENVGKAELELGNRSAARNAFRQALDNGLSATVSPQELNRWKSTLVPLEK